MQQIWNFWVVLTFGFEFQAKLPRGMEQVLGDSLWTVSIIVPGMSLGLACSIMDRVSGGRDVEGELEKPVGA